MLSLSSVSVKASNAPAGAIVGYLSLYNELAKPLPARFILDEGAVGFFNVSSGAIVTMTANVPAGFYPVVVSAVAVSTEQWSEDKTFVIQVQ
jgi:hypothetical protein